jgi:hypothetical protein
MSTAYIAGIKAYIFGYPMVVMDVTRDVLTAVPAPTPEGRGAPINQFTNTPQYVTPDFKNKESHQPTSRKRSVRPRVMPGSPGRPKPTVRMILRWSTRCRRNTNSLRSRPEAIQ